MPDGRLIMTHGWKLHVSTCERDAAETLERCLPLLFSTDVHFKFCRNLECLRRLNRGDAGATQVGKFITVYPEDAAEAVSSPRSLDLATTGLAGLRVPTDWQLRPRSRVSYRYGAFVPQLRKTPTGEVLDPRIEERTVRWFLTSDYRLMSLLTGARGSVCAIRSGSTFSPPGADHC